MDRVLVTGATGFIGRGALSPLLSAGLDVHALSSRGQPAWSPAQVRWHTVDLLDATATAAAVAELEPTHLLHLAWYAEPGAYWRSPENLRWLDASLRLLEAFADRGGRRAVMAGTCAEYRWETRTRCDEASTPLQPATLYGAAKHALHVAAAALAEQRGVSLGWGRIFFVYGPREDERRLAASVARAVLEGERAPISHGRQLRDFLYSEDLAEAFVALLLSDAGGAVNLASGEPVTVADLVERIARAAGHPELVALGERPAPEGEPEAITAEVARLRDEVGWRAAAGLDQRVEELVSWWKDELACRRSTRARARRS